MKYFFWGFFALSLIWSRDIYAQKHKTPPAEDVQLAKELSELFPDESVAYVENYDRISFDLDRGNDKVTVNQETTIYLLNLDSRADIHHASFYDGESEITKFEVESKNQKRTDYRIKDEAYTSDELFHNDVRVKHVYLDFPVNAFTYDIEIEKEIRDIKYFTNMYFIEEYPAAQRKIEIEIPSWLNLELRKLNFENYDISKTVVEGKNGSKIHTYVMKMAKAHHEDENAPGPSHIYPHIMILPQSYTDNGEEKKIFKTTQDLYNWYKSLVDELENDNSDIIEKVHQLTRNAATDEDKIRSIYYWIQDNIRYIAFEDGIAGFKPDEASNVYNKRYGDCKGMANLTKQMLQIAGFDARLTWIGTKRIAYDYSTPNLSVDNHMICTVYLNDKPLFLDGTEHFNSMGEFADRIQGKQVLIENGDQFILENIPVSQADFNAEEIQYDLEVIGGSLQGEVSKNFQGESRASLLSYFHSLKNDRKDEFLEYYLSNGNGNINVTSIETSNLEDRDLDLNVNYEITVQNAVSEFDNEIYIDLDIDKELANYHMKERETDFIFNFKKDLHSTFKLKIPDGYKVSHIPESISLKNDDFQLSVKFEQEEGAIVYKKDFRIENAKVETKDFAEWNGFIEKLNNVYSEQIILTKG